MTSAIATMMTVPNESATGTHERDARPLLTLYVRRVKRRHRLGRRCP